MKIPLIFVALTLAMIVSCSADYNYKTMQQVGVPGKDILATWKLNPGSEESRVRLKVGDSERIVLQCYSTNVTSIFFKGDSLIIRGTRLWTPYPTTKPFSKFVYGFHIILDSAATNNEWNKIYQPEFYDPNKK